MLESVNNVQLFEHRLTSLAHSIIPCRLHLSPFYTQKYYTPFYTHQTPKYFASLLVCQITLPCLQFYYCSNLIVFPKWNTAGKAATGTATSSSYLAWNLALYSLIAQYYDERRVNILSTSYPASMNQLSVRTPPPGSHE